VLVSTVVPSGPFRFRPPAGWPEQIGIDGVSIGYPVAFIVMLVDRAAYYRLVWRKHGRLV